MGGWLSRSRRGFTLVSTILTAVLICLLAGLLAATAWTARGAAERAICTAQLRALAGALIMYRSEHGDYPLASFEVCDAASGDVRQVTWAEVVAPFLNRRNAFVCPCDPSRRSNKRRAAASPPASRSSYEYLCRDARAAPNEAGVQRATSSVGGKRTAQLGAPLLVCRRHQSRADGEGQRTLVAYEDGSVRWDRSPAQPAPQRAPAQAPPRGRPAQESSQPGQSQDVRPSSPRQR